MQRHRSKKTRSRSSSRSSSESPSRSHRASRYSTLSHITTPSPSSISNAPRAGRSTSVHRSVSPTQQHSRSVTSKISSRRHVTKSFCQSAISSLKSFAASPGESLYNIGHGAMVMSQYVGYRLNSTVVNNPHKVDIHKEYNHFIAFGLGNVGMQYVRTRHNVGRDLVYTLGVTQKAPLVNKSHQCEYSDPIILDDVFQWNLNDIHSAIRKHHQSIGLPSTTPIPTKPVKLTLAAPNTFMNVSGKPIKDLVDYLNIPHCNVIIIHDDLEVKSGEVRIRDFGTHGGQRGVKDVLDHFGFNSPFTRIRVGIGRPPEGVEVPDFVLQRGAGIPKYLRLHAMDVLKNIIKYGPMQGNHVVQKAYRKFAHVVSSPKRVMPPLPSDRKKKEEEEANKVKVTVEDGEQSPSSPWKASMKM